MSRGEPPSERNEILSELRALRVEFRAAHEAGMRALQAEDYEMVRNSLDRERELIERQEELLRRYRLQSAGSRTFTVDLPPNQLGPGWRKRAGVAGWH
jgi:hypothetical protein